MRCVDAILAFVYFELHSHRFGTVIGAYFLTHMHEDHLVGLSGAFCSVLAYKTPTLAVNLKGTPQLSLTPRLSVPGTDGWSLGPIYCLQPTASLLCLRYPTLRRLVRVLDIGETVWRARGFFFG
jgi:ribonuclease BN (tRNA processing enzyme)